MRSNRKSRRINNLDPEEADEAASANSANEASNEAVNEDVNEQGVIGENITESSGLDPTELGYLDTINMPVDVKNRKVKHLVRLALSCEYARIPLKKAVINTEVIEGDRVDPRLFRIIFNGAQLQLRNTFGLEMITPPSKLPSTDHTKKRKAGDGGGGASKVNKSSAGDRRLINASEEQNESNGPEPASSQLEASSQGTAASTGSTNAYIVTSILSKEYKAKISPISSERENIYYGLVFLITSLIALNGGIINESLLYHHLDTLGLRNTPIGPMDQMVKQMTKHMYISKTINKPSSESTGAWIEYQLGQRGRCELTRDGIQDMCREIMAENFLPDTEKQIDDQLKTASLVA